VGLCSLKDWRTYLISSNPSVLLGVQSKILYRVLGQPVVGSSGWLEPESDSDETSEGGPWMSRSLDCSTTQVFQQRTNTFSNHSHNQIKDQHTDVFTW
jgi:hypothetical protein